MLPSMNAFLIVIPFALAVLIYANINHSNPESNLSSPDYILMGAALIAGVGIIYLSIRRLMWPCIDAVADWIDAIGRKK